MIEWFTPAELADLGYPGLPTTERAIQIKAKREIWQSRRNAAGELLARHRRGTRGGGFEYHYSLLPALVQAELVHKSTSEKPCKKPTREFLAKNDAWAFYETLSDKRKNKANERLKIIEAVVTLKRGGNKVDLAVNIVASQNQIGTSSIYNWLKLVEGIDRVDWLPYLAPRHSGRTKSKQCDPNAWDMLRSDYLRAERPTFESCFRRLEAAATESNWSIPASRTLERRIKAEVPKPVQVLARHGLEALKQMFPPQERDRSVFHALEAINADGHRWDVWVKWPDGEINRPCMTAIQDVYSGLFLSWRVDKTENKEAFRLAFGDMVEMYGIPSIAYLDNGRNFASKWLTGGTENRYRFKLKADEPIGILTQLGIDIHWTTPYSGQSKPIERGFRDFCDNIAKHPALAGAWTGNTPLNKPENYGSKAIPVEEFIKVVEAGITEHNNRTGRLAPVCRGRSFAETFEQSYVQAPIKKATEEQRRLWLLAAEGVRAATRDGALKLLGNRFWADFLQNHTGQKLVVRFDPQNLTSGIHVYRLDGSYLGFADIIEATGFNDAGAAREHSRARNQNRKAIRAQLEAQRKMTAAEVASQIPVPDQNVLPEAKIVQMTPIATPSIMTGPEEKPVPMTPQQRDIQAEVVADLAAYRPEKSEDEQKRDRFHRARKINEQISAGQAVADDDRKWLERYRTTAEYRAQKTIFDEFGDVFENAG